MKLLLAILLLVFASGASAQSLDVRTLAEVGHGPVLLIGVSDYDSGRSAFGPLQGILDHDLPAMEQSVRTLGFTDVRVVRNPNRSKLEQEVNEFGVKASQSSGVSLFYYSGHGVLQNGRNWMVPADAPILVQGHLETWALPVEHALGFVGGNDPDSATGPALFFIDACRDNRLPSSGKNALSDLRLNRRGGVFIGYATVPGQIANATSTGSPYTQSLAQRLLSPGVSVDDLYSGIIQDVEQITAADADQGATFQPPEKQSALRYVLHLRAGDGNTDVAAMRAELARLRQQMASAPALLDSPGDATGPESATIDRPYVNSLGMEFIPVPDHPGILMCRTETRVRDFRAFADATDFVQAGGADVMKVTLESGSYYRRWVTNADASWENPGFTQTGDHPVVCVNWDESNQFCDWLGQEDGRLVYRLPTDEEWSAAVGTIEMYPWGNEWPAPEGSGNYAGLEVNDGWSEDTINWANADNYNDGNVFSARVASFKANRFGFHDLGGNVEEWCFDSFQIRLHAPEQVDSSSGAFLVEDGCRVVRGGSWFNNGESSLRSSRCLNGVAADRSGQRGFRCVAVFQD